MMKLTPIEYILDKINKKKFWDKIKTLDKTWEMKMIPKFKKKSVGRQVNQTLFNFPFFHSRIYFNFFLFLSYIWYICWYMIFKYY